MIHSRLNRVFVTLVAAFVALGLSSLMRAQTSSTPERNRFLLGLRLYREGKVSVAAEELRAYLLDHQEDARGHYFLSRFDLELGIRDESIREFQILKSSAKPQEQTHIADLEVRLYPEKLTEQKKRLNRALLDLKADDALTIVDQMALLPREKELIKFEINMAQGNLASAMFRLVTIRATMNGSNYEIDAMEKDARTSARNFKEISDKIHWYLYSSFATGTCTPAWARNELPKQNYSLLDYMRLVSNATRLYPLNPWVQDLAFHAALLSAQYEDFESFGDKLLEAKGSIRLPFYSKQSLFSVVVDSRKRRIYTEENSLVKFNEAGSDEMADWVPFDLTFDEITELSQKAQANLTNGSLATKAFALKFSPSGVAPNYTYMGLMHCLYGEAKQKTVTHNLGAYILHVIHRNNIRTSLVDAQKLTRDWLVSTTSALAIGEMMTADYVRQRNPGDYQADLLAGSAMETITANQEEIGRLKATSGAQKEALGNWTHALVQRAFSAIEADQERLLVKDVDDIIAKSGN
jgi:hypothetical protein